MCSNASCILWCVYFVDSFNDIFLRNVLLGRVRKVPVGAYGGERVKLSFVEMERSVKGL